MPDDSFCDNEEGDIDYFPGGKMEDIYQADDRYFDFLERQVRELNEEKNQSILVSMFRALTGSRCRTKRRQVTGIPLTPVTSESTPTSHLNIEATSMQPTPGKMEQDESTLEQLDPIPLVEVMGQPSVDNQLGGSYIMETQVQNDSCQISICSLHSGVQEYLINHFNECLNHKVYNKFKELFWSINVDNIKEALLKLAFIIIPLPGL